MNVASRLPDSSVGGACGPSERRGQAAFSSAWARTSPSALRRILAGNPPIDGSSHQRELHAAGRPAPARARPDSRALCSGDAWRSLSIASTAPPNFDYLQALKDLRGASNRNGLSTSVLDRLHGKNLHDLLPIPYTEEALDHVVSGCSCQDFSAAPSCWKTSRPMCSSTIPK